MFLDLKLFVCILLDVLLIDFFWLFCVLPKIKYKKYENEKKRNRLYVSNLVLSILLVICLIFLAIMYFIGK